MTVETFNSCSREKLLQFIADGRTFDSIVTDPPYGLESIAKRFGGKQVAPKYGRDGSFGRVSERFRGQKWDVTGIERDPEFWRLCFRVLKPGAYMLVFSSPRTGHRVATAIEDAGFNIHPFISWVYGSGMPKQHPADKAIDKHLGQIGDGVGADYVAATEQAREWAGWAYGGQARRPAVEPIYVAQKPFSEKSGAVNMLKHGVGAVNIDGCRTNENRYPANLIHDGSDEAKHHLNGGEFFESYPSELGVLYHRKADQKDRAGIKHPAVKPIGLMRALVRHVTPPNGVVLDPFAGTGTTGEACRIEGLDCVLIEREIQYFQQLNKRFLPKRRLNETGETYLKTLAEVVM